MTTALFFLFILGVPILVFRIIIRDPLCGGAKRLRRAKYKDMPRACTETCAIRGKTGESIDYDCGHRDAAEFQIHLWGALTFMRRPGALKPLCPACMLKDLLAHSIRCGCCGFAILPGNPVALCIDDAHFGKKEWKSVCQGKVLLCLRPDCEGGSSFCGHWTGKGFEPGTSAK